MDDRAGDRRFLLHAGRHFGAEQVANFLHLETFEDQLHAIAEFDVVHAVQSAEVLDHFPGGHAVVDGGVGGNEADLVADHFRLRDAIESADDGGAAGGLQHGAEDAERGGFARAVRAEEAVDLAGLRGERDARKCEDFTAQQVGICLGK